MNRLNRFIDRYNDVLAYCIVMRPYIAPEQIELWRKDFQGSVDGRIFFTNLLRAIRYQKNVKG